MHSYCCHSNNQKSVHYEILKKVSTRERLQILLSIMTQQYLFCLSLYSPHCLFSIHLSVSTPTSLSVSSSPSLSLHSPVSLSLHHLSVSLPTSPYLCVSVVFDCSAVILLLFLLMASSSAIHLQHRLTRTCTSYAGTYAHTHVLTHLRSHANSAFTVSLFQFLIAHSRSFQTVELALDLVFVISAKYIRNICQHNFSHYTLLI